jgi:hypothetical protein
LREVGVSVTIPAPILHPVYISVIIHNRETENPYSLESPVCRAILKAVEESGPTLNQECISLDVPSDDDDSEDDEEESSGGQSSSSSSVGNSRPLLLTGGSKASLASPEDEMDLGSELALTSYIGTSV